MSCVSRISVALMLAWMVVPQTLLADVPGGGCDVTGSSSTLGLASMFLGVAMVGGYMMMKRR